MGIRYFYVKESQTGCPPRLSFAMAGRPLVYFALNVFIMGSGIEGKEIFKFIQKQRRSHINL